MFTITFSTFTHGTLYKVFITIHVKLNRKIRRVLKQTVRRQRPYYIFLTLVWNNTLKLLTLGVIFFHRYRFNFIFDNYINCLLLKNKIYIFKIVTLTAPRHN